MRLFFSLFLLSCAPLQAQGLFAPTSMLASSASKQAALETPQDKLVEKLSPLKGTLFRNTQKGDLVLFEEKNSLALALKMKGWNSEKRDICEAHFTPAQPQNMSYIGKPNGLPRYHTKLLGCDIFIERLGEANMMLGGKCVTQSGCEVEASGLWGDFNALPNEKTIDKDRSLYEKRMNKARQSLMKAYRRTPNLNNFISEQVDFNAQRASLCADFQGEKHGYCGMKLTQARAIELETRLGIKN
jgi:hypothetical protein